MPLGENITEVAPLPADANETVLEEVLSVRPLTDGELAELLVREQAQGQVGFGGPELLCDVDEGRIAARSAHVAPLERADQYRRAEQYRINGLPCSVVDKLLGRVPATFGTPDYNPWGNQ
jgi:hypothetical protein